MLGINILQGVTQINKFLVMDNLSGGILSSGNQLSYQPYWNGASKIVENNLSNIWVSYKSHVVLL